MTKLKTGLLILGLGWGLGPITADAALSGAPAASIAGASTEQVPAPVEVAVAQLRAACHQWPVTDDFTNVDGKRQLAPMSGTTLGDRSLCNDATGKGFQLTHGVILGILAVALLALVGLGTLLLSAGLRLRTWLWRFNDWRGSRSFS